MRNLVFPRMTLAALGLALLVLVSSAQGGEDVTISKARYEELLRKETELDRLKASPNSQPVSPPAPRSKAGSAAGAIAAPAPPPHVAPPLASLPPLAKDELVQALDLAAHYAADPAAADLRYRKHSLRLQGEISGFEKPMFSKDYHLFLKTADRDVRITCQMVTPDRFSAVFSTRNGAELVGVAEGVQVPLARVGDTVTLSGRCRGIAKGEIRLSDCRFEKAK